MADISSIREITDRLQTGVKELFSSDKYAAYLKTMSRFHNYSTRNTLLIHLQRPDATLLCGYNGWKQKFKRHVKKGEHGLKILAPIPFIKKEELEKLDPVTKQPIIGEDGQPVMEEYISVKSARFKPVTIYDIQQTDGEPLPNLVETLSGSVQRYELFVDALRAVSSLPIVFERLPDGTDGKCIFGNRIAIQDGMSEIQTVSAIVHELAHLKLHERRLIEENSVKPIDRRSEEVVAESVAFSTLAYYRIDTDANSFGYIASWSKAQELKELNTCLDIIRKTTAELIDGIDEKFRSLAKERGIDLSEAQDIQGIPEAPETSVSHDVSANQGAPIIISDSPNAQKTPVTPETADSPDIPPETEPPATPALNIPDYDAMPKNAQAIGSNILMTPVFDNNGNFNRGGTRIRVTVEEPSGKYQLFSRTEGENKKLYFLTASGMIENTGRYFRDDWNAETHKYENHRPIEKEFDEVIPLVTGRFESDMSNPRKWALYQDAAVMNRISECEAHNMPVRKLYEDEERQLRAEAIRERQEKQRLDDEKFNSRVDEIAAAIKSDKTIMVAYKENEYGGKNPVLELFKLYGIELPLRTQGWVNTGLASLTEGSYSFYKSKHKGNSTAFGGYLKKLREAIAITPIEQKRPTNIVAETDVSDASGGADTGSQTARNKEGYTTIENKLYEKLSQLFPEFMDGKYSYVRLESDGFEPLSLEWIFGDRISVMHTYEQNGDLCYDPMMEFIVRSADRKLEPCRFEQSIPPVCQYFDDDGIGKSICASGEEHILLRLQSRLNNFASQWLDNIAEQDYKPVRGTFVLGEGSEIRVTFDKDGNVITPETLMPKTTEPDIPLPDTSINTARMAAYGYTEPDMYPLSTDRAVELFDNGHPIYLLYPDNTEALAFDRDELITFGGDGLCGITKADWAVSPIYAAQMETLEKAHESFVQAQNETKSNVQKALEPINPPRQSVEKSKPSLLARLNEAKKQALQAAPPTAESKKERGYE